MKTKVLTFGLVVLKIVLFSIGIFALKNAFSFIKTIGDPMCYLCFTTDNFPLGKFFLWSALFTITISVLAQKVWNWGASANFYEEKGLGLFCFIFLGSFLLLIPLCGSIYAITHAFGGIFDMTRFLFWGILVADFTIISGIAFLLIILVGIWTRLVR